MRLISNIWSSRRPAWPARQAPTGASEGRGAIATGARTAAAMRRSWAVSVRASLVVSALALSACTDNFNWSHNREIASLGRTADELVTKPSDIMITTGDFEGRAYQRLGHLRVRVIRTTPIHPPASRSEADAELQDEAARLGADAVILVKYGNRTPDFLGLATLDATGTAIKFID